MVSHVTQGSDNWALVLGGLAGGVALGLGLAHARSVSGQKRPKKIKITYFDIAGVAEKVRLAFTLGGVEFEDERIQFAQWQALKATTPYGQLPVMVMDGKTFTQSDAMMRFAGRLTPSLYPIAHALEVDEALGLVDDFIKAWSPSIYIAMKPNIFGYPESFKGTDGNQAVTKAMREDFVANDLPRFLNYFTAKIEAAGGAFICGPNPTIADCMLVPELRKFTQGYMDFVPTTSLDGSPAIVAYIARFQALPKVKAYYAAKA